MKQRVIGNNEKEGGERTPLLDAPKDVNPFRQFPSEEGSNLDRREGAFDKVLEPRGKTVY